MARFEHTVFVCTHERPQDSGKASCGGQGSKDLLERLRAEVKAHGLKGRVRVTSSGCLDLCARGCVAVAFRAPTADGSNAVAQETWYSRLTADDAEELFAEQVLKNGQYERHVEPTRSLTSAPREPVAK